VKGIGCENTYPSMKNVNLKEIGDLTSGSEDETESRKMLLRYDEKKWMNDAKQGRSEKSRMSTEEEILETKNFTHKTKLKDIDISQLLDDDFNEVFISNRVTDKSKCGKNFQLKSSHQRIAEKSKSAVYHVKKTYEANTADVETVQMQGRSGYSSLIFSDRMSSGVNSHKRVSKVNLNSIKLTSEVLDLEKDNFDLTSALVSPSKTVRNNKQERRNNVQHSEQWQQDTEDYTKLKSLKATFLENSPRSYASASVSAPGCRLVESEEHSGDKVGKLSKSQSALYAYSLFTLYTGINFNSPSLWTRYFIDGDMFWLHKKLVESILSEL
jgi:hypothetical protein